MHVQPKHHDSTKTSPGNLVGAGGSRSSGATEKGKTSLVHGGVPGGNSGETVFGGVPARGGEYQRCEVEPEPAEKEK
jgi:hypothetical protein